MRQYKREYARRREGKKRAYYELNKNRILSASRTYHIFKKYKLTPDAFYKKLKDQNFCCASCKIPYFFLKRHLVVDHCHKTEKIRGLLCPTCNLALGHAKDSIEILNGLISYLSRH